MALGAITWIIITVIIVVLILIGIYNRLIRLRNQANNAWAQIDVQLKRRVDLIPNLINTVKGYVKHERQTLESITKARTSLMKATTLDKKAAASDAITSALKTLFAVAENYPNLKANENFLQLQEELSGTESKIAYSRQAYNDAVLSLNNAIQVFPSNMFARMMNFKEKEMFKTVGKEREPVKVEF